MFVRWVGPRSHLFLGGTYAAQDEPFRKKGFFKKKYVLTAQLVLTSEELALVKQHRLGDFELFNAEESWGSPHVFIVTAGGYITKGSNFDCASINDLAILEECLQQKCQEFAKQLKSLKGAFDGAERAISFDN